MKYRLDGRITGSSAEESRSSLEKVRKGEMAMFLSWQKCWMEVFAVTQKPLFLTFSVY